MEKIKEFLRLESGYGSGSGDGCGSGYGYGSGSGYGCGYGCGITSINNQAVYQIDGVPTVITHIRGIIAKGFILNDDFTLDPCYVAKGHNMFAHGESIKAAVEALQEKIFENLDPDEAIEMFLKEFPDPDIKCPAKAFYVWHHRLTGSCEMGRNAFVRNGGYDLENDEFTVSEFINITRNAYGGEIIRQLEEKIKEA